MDTIGRWLVVLGFVFLGTGGVILALTRFAPWLNRFSLGHLPGDFRFQSGNFTCILGLGTSLVLSILLTIILNIVMRILNH
jgi:hypothetical protein